MALPQRKIYLNNYFQTKEAQNSMFQLVANESEMAINNHIYWITQVNAAKFTKYIVDENGLKLGSFARDFVLTGIDKTLDNYMGHWADLFFSTETEAKIFDFLTQFASSCINDTDLKNDLYVPLRNLNRANNLLTPQNTVLGMGVHLIYSGIESDDFAVDGTINLDAFLYER
jgi:hypothetical protein